MNAWCNGIICEIHVKNAVSQNRSEALFKMWRASIKTQRFTYPMWHSHAALTNQFAMRMMIWTNTCEVYAQTHAEHRKHAGKDQNAFWKFFLSSSSCSSCTVHGSRTFVFRN